MRTPTTELQAMATMDHTDSPIRSSCSMVDWTAASGLTSDFRGWSAAGASLVTSATLLILLTLQLRHSSLPHSSLWFLVSMRSEFRVLRASAPKPVGIHCSKRTPVFSNFTKPFVKRELLPRSRSPNSNRPFGNMAEQQQQRRRQQQRRQ